MTDGTVTCLSFPKVIVAFSRATVTFSSFLKAAMVALAMGSESASMRAIHWDWTLCKLSLPMTTPSRLLSDIMGFKDPRLTMKARDSNKRELDLAECREIQGLRLGMSLLAVSVPVNATMLEVHLLVFP